MKKHQTAKTNAARILDAKRVAYELREYEVDEQDLSATHVAELVGLPPMQVFKTLVARGDRTGVMLACIPGARELDPKALAETSGNKKVELVAVKDIHELTGYVRGGVSPVGTRKAYPFYLEASAMDWPFISVSAGVRGCQMLVDPKPLAQLLNARLCNIAKGEG